MDGSTHCTGAGHLWAPWYRRHGWLRCARSGCYAVKVAPLPPVSREPETRAAAPVLRLAVPPPTDEALR